MTIRDLRSKSADAVDTAFDIARDDPSGTWAEMARRIPGRIKSWGALLQQTGEFQVPKPPEPECKPK
jgi:hypothetical protein